MLATHRQVIRDSLHLIDRISAYDDPFTGPPSPYSKADLVRLLETIIPDTDLLQDHIEGLVQVFRSVGGFPELFTELLDFDLEQRILEEGLHVLEVDELVRLTVNPIALHSLVDELDESISEAWIQPVAEAGQRMARRQGIDLGQIPIDLPNRPISPAEAD